MTHFEIREKFKNFMESRNHVWISSTGVVPENDPSILFITAGMQPLAPYLMGEKHPQGVRLANIQKCIRTQDIDEVGDNTHNTFFEMIGFWSLGDYFKEEAIKQSYTFFTQELGLDPDRLYVTCFAGDENAPKDEESARIWMDLGISEDRIYFLSTDSNWWSPGDNGPCGPDSEMFYDMTDDGLGDISHDDFLAADDRQEVVEIGNNVFMSYLKKDGVIVGELPAKNVDMGSGFERLVTVVQRKKSVFETDLFKSTIKLIIDRSEIELDSTSRDARIIADHIRTSVILISDGVLPANKDQGYILRRLLRRAIRIADKIGYRDFSLLVKSISDTYGEVYENLKDLEKISSVISAEEDKFRKTLSTGIREFEKKSKDGNLSGVDAFLLFSSYGFPIEVTQELAQEKGIDIDMDGYMVEFEKHQVLSRKGAEKKFKGGLSGHGEMETKLHTATHLLHAALHEILGEHATQRGSNINSERLRFDFNHDSKMTDEEKEAVDVWVNDKIEKDLPVVLEEMNIDEAKESEATGLFEDKYGDKVTVYSIGDVSKELCGGPHVTRTGKLGKFRIKKEEASSAGVRRIKAVLE
jgi:alanyl-tRNA synthetase